MPITINDRHFIHDDKDKGSATMKSIPGNDALSVSYNLLMRLQFIIKATLFLFYSDCNSVVNKIIIKGTSIQIIRCNTKITD